MNDKELIKYVKEEFVNSGFIIVNQWKNFIDYLQILLNKEREQALLTQKQEDKNKIIDFYNWFQKEFYGSDLSTTTYDKILKKIEELKQKLGEMK